MFDVELSIPENVSPLSQTYFYLLPLHYVRRQLIEAAHVFFFNVPTTTAVCNAVLASYPTSTGRHLSFLIVPRCTWQHATGVVYKLQTCLLVYNFHRTLLDRQLTVALKCVCVLLTANNAVIIFKCFLRTAKSNTSFPILKVEGK